MESFAKRGNGFHQSNIFAKRSILDTWQDAEYASDSYPEMIQNNNFPEIILQDRRHWGSGRWQPPPPPFSGAKFFSYVKLQ